MKKIVSLFLVCFFLTGCLNGNRDFTAECYVNNNSSGFTSEEKIIINFNRDDEITKIIKTTTFEYTSPIGKMSFDSAKASYNSVASFYQQLPIIESILMDEDALYQVEATFAITDMTDENLTRLGIVRNYYEQIKQYRLTMTCN